MHERTGSTTIFVTHDQEEAFELADRVVIMSDGRIDQIGSADQIHDHPATPFVARFMGAVVELPVTLRAGRPEAAGLDASALERRALADGPATLFLRPDEIGLASDEASPWRVARKASTGPNGGWCWMARTGCRSPSTCRAVPRRRACVSARPCGWCRLRARSSAFLIRPSKRRRPRRACLLPRQPGKSRDAARRNHPYGEIIVTLKLVRAAALALGLAAPFAATPAAAQDAILNVSYDIARELFAALNPAFAAKWQADTGRTVTIDQSHGGSSRQARAILEGLPADVVTFNQETDIDVLAEGGLVPADWRTKLPNDASPYYSLPAFLVRKGNPKGIKDWADLARDDVQPVFPNPKTSGNARYTYLAAYAYGLEQNGGDQAKAQELVKKILSNVPVFDTGGRAATQTFAERDIGDVLVTFEAETAQIAREYADKGFERVTPSVSLFAAFPVATVTANTEKKGTTEISDAYLNWLYSPEAQEILATQSFRVHDEAVAAKHTAEFPEVRLLTVEEVFGGWDKIKTEHLADGAILDQVFVNR